MTRRKNNNTHYPQNNAKPKAIIETKTDGLSELEASIKEKRERVLKLSQITDNRRLKYHLLTTTRELIPLLVKYGLQNKDKHYDKSVYEELGYLNLLAGQIFITLNNTSLAKECLWDSIAYKPEQYLAYYHLAILAVEGNDYKLAYRYITTAIKYTPNDAEHRKTLYLMGCMEYMLGSIDAAIVSFKLLVKDKMIIANYPLCLCYIIKKQHQPISEIAKGLTEIAINNELLNNFNHCILIASNIFINADKVDIPAFEQRLAIDFMKVNTEIPINDIEQFINYFAKAVNLAKKRQSQFNLFKAVPTKKTESITNHNPPLTLEKENVYRNY